MNSVDLCGGLAWDLRSLLDVGKSETSLFYHFVISGQGVEKDRAWGLELGMGDLSVGGYKGELIWGL